MKPASLILFALCAAALNCCATTLLPPINEAEARAAADVVAEAKVLSITRIPDDGLPEKQSSVIAIEILTKGVSAKTNVTVLWNQSLADASTTPQGPPVLGQKYWVHLRLPRGPHQTDFEPVDPNWGFVEWTNAVPDTGPSFIEHTVQRGDTLWGIAARYYGKGTRWRVLRAANFTNDAALGVYPLTSGMRLRIPTFSTNSPPQKASPGTRRPHPTAILLPTHYDAAETIFRAFFPDKSEAAQFSNSVFFVSYGSYDSDLPQDFLGRFAHEPLLVTNASAATVKTNFTIIHSPSGRIGRFLELRQLRLTSDTAEAWVGVSGSGGSGQGWRIIVRREAEGWKVADKTLVVIACP